MISYQKIGIQQLITLRNNTGSTSKIGYAVSLDSRDKGAFVYATFGATKVIGIITEAVPYRKPCKIATQGDKASVFVVGNVVKDNSIRLAKSTDRASLGSSVIAKSGDSPYLKIGDALNSGRGLIEVILNLSYSAGGSSTVVWSDITGTPTTVSGYGITDALGVEFETVSKNLKSYPYVLTYGVDGIDTITYDLEGGLSIVKTFNYTLGVLTSIVLSGDTPDGISLTKTLIYTGDDLTSVSYS